MAKWTEFYVEHMWTHLLDSTVNILLNILVVSRYIELSSPLSIYQSILLFDTFQSKLHTSVLCPQYCSTPVTYAIGARLTKKPEEHLLIAKPSHLITRAQLGKLPSVTGRDLQSPPCRSLTA